MRTFYFEKNEDETIYCLIIYDIADDKRRTKIAKILEGYGVRVQLSAFEVWISKISMTNMMEKIERIRKKEDNIRVYNLDKNIGQNKIESKADLLRSDVFIF